MREVLIRWNMDRKLSPWLARDKSSAADHGDGERRSVIERQHPLSGWIDICPLFVASRSAAR